MPTRATVAGEGDDLVKGAAELVAAAYAVDRHEVGTDYAGQLFAWTRLPGHAENDQSIQSDGAGAPLWPRGQQYRSTSKMIVSDSVVGLTSDFDGGTQHSRAVTGHAVGIARPSRPCLLSFLRFVFGPSCQAP